VIDRLAGSIAELQTYYRLNREAAWTLRQLYRDGRRLRRRDARAAFDYAQARFGSRRNVLWLLVYSTVRGEFHDGWFPSDLHRQVVLPRINGAVGSLSAAKTLAARLFPSDAWPDTGYLINGTFYDRAMQPIAAPRLLETLFGDRRELIVKGDVSRKGRNVRIIPRELETLMQLRGSWHGRPLTFQERILPHAAFDEIAPGAAATVRLISVREANGTVTVRGGHFRFPGADELLVRSSQAYRCAVDTVNGCLGSEFVTAQWQRVSHHPRSGRRFERIPIPGYRAAAELVCALHARVPQLAMIGWDLMIDEQARPRLLEWNGVAPGIVTSEAFCGPHFADLGWERFAATRRRRD
jgi:hypothetical protein